MAELPFLDSIQHYSIPNSTRKYTSRANGTIDPSGGRDGNPCFSNFSGTESFTKTFLNEYASFTIGAAYKFHGGFEGFLCQASNARFGTFPVEGVATLSSLGDGRLLINFGNAAPAVVLGFVADLDIWYFIEVNFTLSVSGGHTVLSWELHVDNGFASSGTLTDTSGQYATFASITIAGFQGSMCDIYVTSGEFFGDTSCRAYFPRVDGTYTAGVPSTGGSHFSMVKEHDPDDLATTIDLQNTSDRDSYLMDTINFYIGVKAAQFLWCARKTEPGLSSFKGTLTSGASDMVTQEFFPNFSFFLYFIDSFRLSPHTGVDWTVAELNAQEVGEQRIT